MNLELELTEVKESLKKALSGGVTLGLTIEPKAGSSGLQVRTPTTIVVLRLLCDSWRLLATAVVVLILNIRVRSRRPC